MCPLPIALAAGDGVVEMRLLPKNGRGHVEIFVEGLPFQSTDPLFDVTNVLSHTLHHLTKLSHSIFNLGKPGRCGEGLQ